MKKIIAILIFSLLFQFKNYAQLNPTDSVSLNKWVDVESPTTMNLKGIKFIDNNNGIAWGDSVLIETINGGLNWEVRTTFSSNGSSFADRNNGWIIINKYQNTDSNVVLYTSDGGNSWTKQFSYKLNPSEVWDYWLDGFNNIFFVDDKNGWVVEGYGYHQISMWVPGTYIFRTTDGGKNWNYISNVEFGTGINYLQFIDENVGWAQGTRPKHSGDIYKYAELYLTTDGGNSWISKDYDFDEFEIYYRAYFLNQFQGWFCKVTYDKGMVTLCAQNIDSLKILQTWEDYGPKLLYFKNSQLGWFFGEAGFPPEYLAEDYSTLYYRFISMTTDGGLTWEEQKFDLSKDFPRIKSFFSLDGKLCWAVGNNGIMLRYGDIDPMPVELFSFVAKKTNNSVYLIWKTATEINNYGFNVEKKIQNKENWETLGFVKGNGNSNIERNYSFVDRNPLNGKNLYRLKQINTNGSFSYSNIIEVIIETPKTFLLQQNYPNPFNPSTTIHYEIPTDTYVELNIYDVLGKEVKILERDFKLAGRYNIEFNASNLSSGVYYYQIRAGGFIAAKKMILIK